MLPIKFKLLREGAKVPYYATSGAAGADLYLCDEHDNEITLVPFEGRLFGTGLAMQIPHGYEVQVRPRSGLAAKHGVTVVNSPGTIDSDYRGEVKVILMNQGKDAVTFKTGDRIAQMVVSKVYTPVFQVVEELNDTDRGEGGMGSTGR